MLSAEYIAAVKVAIETCNNPELKREVLCAPGSDYDINKGSNQYGNKKHWDETVKKKAAITLRNLGLPEMLHKKVMVFVPLVGMKMLTWAEYHEGILGLSREYSIGVFSGSFFTSQGIIDNKKAVEQLLNNEDLNIKQKYKLACLYCVTDHIFVLNRKMSKEDKEEFYDARNPGRINQPELVKFWSYFLMCQIYKLRGDRNLDLYMLEQAIESGSKAAVQYCFEKTNLSRKKYALVNAAVISVRNRTMECDDWIVFRDHRCDDSQEKLVPSDYYVDILCYLLSKMSEDQRIYFLKRDTDVLYCFLNWPYQDYFIKTAKLMWEYLSEKEYVVLLLNICDKIEAREGTLKNGEEKSYDYRDLLKEFWCLSSEHYKRYFFSNPLIYYSGRIHTRAGADLLSKLISLKKFTYKDTRNIKLIFASAADKEKENVIYSQEWIDLCEKLISEEKWEILDRFLLNFFLSKEDANNFKRKFTKEAQYLCIYLVHNVKWNVAESFIKWSSLTEEEINKLKIEMIYSKDGMLTCTDLIYIGEDVKNVNKFIEWFVSSEEVGKFKKELIFSSTGVECCSRLVKKGKIELADEFTKWCLSSEEEIKELKKDMAYIKGYSLCKILISHYSVKCIHDEGGCFIGRKIKFEGGKWEQVEKFLTWCFSSETEIDEFKTKLRKVTGERIHFNLIKCNRWEEAEAFFAWLGLSAEEIKELKQETLFNYCLTSDMFCDLMYSKEGEEREIFIDCGSKQETIELLFRWCLPDKETVLKFRNVFKSQFRGEETENRKSMLENFDLMIEQRLNDLDEEQRGQK